MNDINIKKQNQHKILGTFYSEFFKEKIEFIAEEITDFDYVESCLNSFNNMSESLVSEILEETFKYYKKSNFTESLDEDLKIIISTPAETLNYIQPNVFIINERTKGPIIHLELECDWEPEHGLEWLIKGEELQYVGPFEGKSISSFDSPEKNKLSNEVIEEKSVQDKIAEINNEWSEYVRNDPEGKEKWREYIEVTQSRNPKKIKSKFIELFGQRIYNVVHKNKL